MKLPNFSSQDLKLQVKKKMPKLLFIHGPPACGKLTIAKELALILPYKLFHNHLLVDTLLSVFDFGSPNFVKHREKIWLDIIGDAILEGSDVIFTFNPEASVGVSFPQDVRNTVEKNGGNIVFIEISCSEIEIESRIESQTRKDYKKLSSLEFYLQLRSSGAFEFPTIASDIVIDSASMDPIEAAHCIASKI